MFPPPSPSLELERVSRKGAKSAKEVGDYSSCLPLRSLRLCAKLFFSVRDSGRGLFAERLQVGEALQRKWRDHRRRPAGGDQLGDAIPRRRRRLEAVRP